MVSTKSILASSVLLFAMASAATNTEPLPAQNTLDTPVNTTTISTASADASGVGCGPAQSADKNLPCVETDSITAENLLERGEEAAMLI